MPLKFTRDPKVITQNLIKVVKDIPRIAGVEAERFFKDSFRRQGWHDKVFTPWKARGGARTRALGEKRQGRAVLIKSGALRRSVRVIRIGANFVIVGSSLPYAQIHNEGGTITGTHSVRAHKRRGRKGAGEFPVQAHSRTVNTKIPRRRFIGNSMALNLEISKIIRYRIRRS